MCFLPAKCNTERAYTDEADDPDAARPRLAPGITAMKYAGEALFFLGVAFAVIRLIAKWSSEIHDGTDRTVKVANAMAAAIVAAGPEASEAFGDSTRVRGQPPDPRWPRCARCDGPLSRTRGVGLGRFRVMPRCPGCGARVVADPARV